MNGESGEKMKKGGEGREESIIEEKWGGKEREEKDGKNLGGQNAHFTKDTEVCQFLPHLCGEAYIQGWWDNTIKTSPSELRFNFSILELHHIRDRWVVVVVDDDDDVIV